MKMVVCSTECACVNISSIFFVTVYCLIACDLHIAFMDFRKAEESRQISPKVQLTIFFPLLSTRTHIFVFLYKKTN